MSDVCDFMSGPMNKIDINTISLQSVYEFVQAFTSENFASFFSQGRSLWYATVGPHDALIVPCGFITIDSVQGADVFGHKLNILLGTSKVDADFKALLAESVRSKRFQSELEMVAKVMADRVAVAASNRNDKKLVDEQEVEASTNAAASTQAAAAPAAAAAAAATGTALGLAAAEAAATEPAPPETAAKVEAGDD